LPGGACAVCDISFVLSQENFGVQRSLTINPSTHFVCIRIDYDEPVILEVATSTEVRMEMTPRGEEGGENLLCLTGEQRNDTGDSFRIFEALVDQETHDLCLDLLDLEGRLSLLLQLLEYTGNPCR
ncbi:MAG: hypothetical protein D6812_11210, partial [Deltaproteobacteria bacterium]